MIRQLISATVATGLELVHAVLRAKGFSVGGASSYCMVMPEWDACSFDAIGEISKSLEGPASEVLPLTPMDHKVLNDTATDGTLVDDLRDNSAEVVDVPTIAVNSSDSILHAGSAAFGTVPVGTDAELEKSEQVVSDAESTETLENKVQNDMIMALNQVLEKLESQNISLSRELEISKTCLETKIEDNKQLKKTLGNTN